MSAVFQTPHPIFRDAPAEMPTFSDEVYFGDYHAVSQSMLKLVAEKRLVRYHSYFVSRCLPFDEPSRQMELGTAIHGCVLEGKRLDDVLRVIPPSCLKSNGAINPKPTEEFRASLPADCTAAKESEFYAATAAVEAVRTRIKSVLEHPNALFERNIYWTHESTGLRCRLKSDIILPVQDTVIVVDLKNTDDATDNGFAKQITRMRYWLQAATYTEGVRAWAKDVLGIQSPTVEFRFLAIERDIINGTVQTSEHMLLPYVMSQAEAARDRYMRTLADCYENNRWQDEWEQRVNMVSIPDYAFGNLREVE